MKAEEVLLRILDMLEAMDKRFEEKLQLQADKIEELNDELSVYNVELTRHIEGVNLAREENKMLRERFEKDMQPIKAHVNLVSNGFKFIGMILSFFALIFGLFSALKGLF